MTITKIKAIRDYFSTAEKPITSQELIELRKASSDSFDELAEGAAKELGEELEVK